MLRVFASNPNATWARVHVLLHHEQFKIPENLARFAVKAGMGGFIKKLGPAVQHFVEQRRLRVDPVSHLHFICRIVQLRRASTLLGLGKQTLFRRARAHPLVSRHACG